MCMLGLSRKGDKDGASKHGLHLREMRLSSGNGSTRCCMIRVQLIPGTAGHWSGAGDGVSK
jgi:hypothetical protein